MLYQTLYELSLYGTTLGIDMQQLVPAGTESRPVRITVRAEDGIVDYVFDLSFDQALSVAEAILHGARNCANPLAS
jgi:hypothetical protein